MSSSSLSDLVRQVAAEHPNAHPHKIAILVAELVPEELLRDYLASVLERVVADVLRANRNAALNSKQGRSPKVEQRRSWWQRILRERVHVGDSVWKPLGECGIADFDFCIAEREDQIGALQEQITKYRTIRDAMIAHGVETAADLPEGAVEL